MLGPESGECRPRVQGDDPSMAELILKYVMRWDDGEMVALQKLDLEEGD
jgi:hypothetical protein